MKRKLSMIGKSFVLFLVLSSVSVAEEKIDNDEWDLYEFKVYFENDMFGVFTDSQYSSGEKFNLTYHVNKPTNFLYNLLYSSDTKSHIFTTFGVANQIYTPVDLEETSLIVDDRPYGGWTYFEMGIHKSSQSSLNSISLKVGAIGPASKSEEIQNTIHKLVNAGLAMGWDNQLGNELGVNLSYIYKLRYTPKPIMGWIESSVVPYVEADLGNISTQMSLGTFARVGYNISKDFGLSTLDSGGDAGIPSYEQQKVSLKKDWSFSLNLGVSGSVIARDIFLDGNTFSDSHSVAKNNFVAYVTTGFSLRYKAFTLDLMNTTNTKKSPKEGVYQDVGTMIASWTF